MQKRLILLLAITTGGCATERPPAQAEFERQGDPPAWLQKIVSLPDAAASETSPAILAQERVAVERKREFLIHQLDCQALLRDCRWVIASRGRIPAGYKMPSEDGKQWAYYIHPQEPRLPEAIRKLNSRVVVVTEEAVAIDCGTRECPLALFGFRPHSEAEQRCADMDDWIKIIDGLWIRK